ncbi:MAG TPA: LTA synthase family protein, partial [Ferruginibacter sp.]|nr:LTA synthase family protein [Ferruginibacter sp.]
AWGFRLDTSPLKYLESPKEAWASVSHLPVFWGTLFFLLLYLLLLYVSKRFITAGRKLIFPPLNRSVSFIVVLLLTGLFIIPLRGGLQLAPINQSSVYFSQSNFANLAAINAPWNFLFSLTHNTSSGNNPFIYIENNEADSILKDLFQAGNKNQQFINLSKHPSPNVILIVWESFSSKAIDLEKEGRFITPGFNLLKQEGIYFSNLYASGDRTDKGIVAVLSGYPSQPTTSIIKIPAKAAGLPMVSNLFNRKGYDNSFYYGGELEFANIKAYLLNGAFNKMISVNDFSENDKNSKWGAHDGVVMKRLIGDLGKSKQPFFSAWLTLSSHEPFETPVPAVLHGNDDETLFLNSLHYSDAVVYEFVRECRQQQWWDNTLIAIVADHGHRLPSTGKKPDDFKIPFLLLGGVLDSVKADIKAIGSQTDIPAILLSQLGYDHSVFKWSKNLLDSTVKQWGYFSFNNGFGFIQPSNYFVFDNQGKRIIEKQGNVKATDIKKGQAILQKSFQDYLEK